MIDSISGGGAELVVSNLCRHISRDEFDVSVCYLKEKGCRGEELESESYDVFDVKAFGSHHNKYLQFLSLRQAVQKKAIHLVHSHSTGSLVEASLCRLVCPNVHTVHTFHFGNYPHYNRKYLLMERLFSSVPNQLVAVGNEQRQAIMSTLGIPVKRIMTVWNGVERGRETTDTSLPAEVPAGKTIIGSLSTCIPQKGLEYLLDVAFVLKQKRNDFVVLIVGDGPLRPDLERKCSALHLGDTVFFLGWVTDAPSRVLPHFDIFVQSSLWEAMSMVILEAMAAGKPIVATEVGENRHVIKDGESGFLCKPKDVDGMARYLDRLLSHADVRGRVGEKAREEFNASFTVDRMARNYERLYRHILGL